MYIFALDISGFRRCGSSSTAAIVSILLFPPTKSRIMTANSDGGKFTMEKLSQTSKITSNLRWCVRLDYQCLPVECNWNPLEQLDHPLSPKRIETILFASRFRKSCF